MDSVPHSAHAASKVEVPLGEGCDPYHPIGCDMLRFKKFDDFATKYLDDTTTNLRTTVDTIRANLDKPGSAGDWKPTEASKAVEYECSIKRTFRGYEGTHVEAEAEDERARPSGPHQACYRCRYQA